MKTNFLQTLRNISALQLLLLLLSCFTLLGIANLAYLPIAWTDEIMNLDPALQFHKHGVYKGFLWPNEGSNRLFLCYPPLIQWFHIATMYVLPFDIFWMRLPFLIIHVVSLYLLFRICSKLSNGQNWMSLLFVVLFMFDKVVFEISRSMRVEVLLTFLIVLLVWLFINKKSIFLQGIIAGFLLLAHLNMWPWLGIWAVFSYRNWRKLSLFSLSAALPIFLFFWSIDFQFQELYHQLFNQASQHASKQPLGQRIADFLWIRFWPVYKEQPWALLFTPIFILTAFYSIVKKHANPFAWAFLGTSLIWILVLAPHYRYWPPLFAAGIIMLAYELKDSKRPLIPATAVNVGILMLLTLGFWARHALAFSQRASRNPDSALSWLDTQLQQEVKTLIVGEGIAFYSTQNPNFDYGITFYPQQLHFQSYAKVYCLTRDSLPYTLISSYKVKDNTTLPQLQQWQRGETYAGMKLYLIKTKSEWDSLTGKYQKNHY